jgi:hypothetical protein
MARGLQAVVEAGLDKRRAQRIARESRQQEGFVLRADGPRFRGPWYLTIPLDRLLNDDADWNAVTWRMDPVGLDRLAVTLEWLYGELGQEFTFAAMWAEEVTEKLVSRDELLRIVRAGRIETRTRYRVPGAGAHPM